MAETVTLQDVVEMAGRLSLLDKVRLIERITPEIERGLESTLPTPKRSLWGVCAHLGAAPSAEDINKTRGEVWANFPREDI